MKPVYKFFLYPLIRLGPRHSLIFFAFIIHAGCHNDTAGEDITITWSAEQATGISIPRHLLDADEDSLSLLLKIKLPEDLQGSMLGHFEISRQTVHFKPLIPLTPGQVYHVVFRNRQIATVVVPAATRGLRPEITAVYPTSDTVPENLLKFYILFSSPMREGEALQHIFLLNQLKDTIPAVFLDLQPELWNEDRTALTLWLDPGRIKRDLIPNRSIGNPLQANQHYTLLVADTWKNAKGLALKESFSKRFVVYGRDSTMPDPGSWKLVLPPAESTIPLVIDTREPLDYFLLQETISITDNQNIPISGSIKVQAGENQVLFQPVNQWIAGPYRLTVKPILEDLAGNNLQRPFDRDITRQPAKAQSVYRRRFIVK